MQTSWPHLRELFGEGRSRMAIFGVRLSQVCCKLLSGTLGCCDGEWQVTANFQAQALTMATGSLRTLP